MSNVKGANQLDTIDPPKALDEVAYFKCDTGSS